MARQHSKDFNITGCFNHMTDPLVHKEAPELEETKHEMKYEDDYEFSKLIDMMKFQNVQLPMYPDIY